VDHDYLTEERLIFISIDSCAKQNTSQSSKKFSTSIHSLGLSITVVASRCIIHEAGTKMYPWENENWQDSVHIAGTVRDKVITFSRSADTRLPTAMKTQCAITISGV
jgi:hypothetical protein